MTGRIENINDTVGHTVTIYGLPESVGIPDGTDMKVVWINDLHVELKTLDGVRICLRTHIAERVMYYHEKYNL